MTLLKNWYISKGRSLIRFISLLSSSLILFSLSSCQSSSSSFKLEETSVSLEALLDVHLAEAALKQARDNERDSLRVLYYQRIEALHGVKTDDLDEVFRKLKQDPKAVEKIYEKLLEELNKKDVKN